MAAELFTANRATTTVTSGGTDAPAGGTQETWTVGSSAMFGAAATGASQFHVADPAAPSELVAVTNVSGTTWTVTRGAESTTPVTHQAGFTVFQVVTAGWLGTVGSPGGPAADVATAAPGTLLAWNYPSWGANGNTGPAQTAGTNGTLFFLKVCLQAAITVTDLNFFVVNAGSGASVEHAFVGLCNSGGTVVATSADRAADSALTSANTVWAAPLSSPYSAAAGTYYALMLVYMNSGGTNPTFACVNSTLRVHTAGQVSGAFDAMSLAAQTSIGSSYTLTSNSASGNWFWVALS